MDTSTVIWIVIAIVVVVAVIALAVWLARRNSQTRRVEKAEDIRSQAQERETDVRRHEAEAAEVDARRRQAQAEADAKAAQAERLAADAHDTEATAGRHREELDTEYRTADEIDPRTEQP